MEITMLNNEIKEALELVERGVMYVKIVKSDRHNYEPFF